MSDKQRAKTWKLALNLVTVVALAGLAYAVRGQLAQTLQNLYDVNLFWVSLIIPLEILNHYAQAGLYQGLFRVLGHRFRLRSMFRLSLELNFVNTVFPSGGVSGFSYLSLRMKDEKITTATSTLVQTFRFILVFVSFQILLFLGLILLAVGGRASNLTILLAGSIATLAGVFTLGLAFVVGSRSRINGFFTFVAKALNRLIQFVRPKNPETINISSARRTFTELHENYMHIRRDMSVLKRPMVWALIANLAEVAVVYTVYVAFGQAVNPGAVIIAYAVANFAGLVSVLPGGIGIYEALMTGALAAGGIPPSVSLPVTVMFRVLNMLVQLPPGYYFYQKNLHADPTIQEKITDTDRNSQHLPL